MCVETRDDNTQIWRGGQENKQSQELAILLDDRIRNSEIEVERQCRCVK